MENQKKDISRRQFIKASAIAVGSVAAIGFGVEYIKKYDDSGDFQKILRPPGAILENDFIYACIKCGLCVQICPVHAIKLSGINQILSYGTPYIDVRNQACDFSCDSLQCVETCPTAALNFLQFKEVGEKAVEEYDKTHSYEDPGYNPFKSQIAAMKAAVKMGSAFVLEKSCLAVKGKGFKGTPRDKDFEGIYRTPNNKEKFPKPVNTRVFDREICDLCVTECPIGETAIILDKSENNGQASFKPKVLDGCTGCGVCVMVCPTEPSSIVIEPKKA